MLVEIVASVVCSLTCAVLTFLFFEIRRNTPKKILGVYSQPGKWFYLKYITFFLLLTARRLKYIVVGKRAFFNEKNLEKLQPLSGHDKAFDAVFFQAVSQDGFSLCGGTERRQQGKVNGLFYIMTPKHGLLLSEKLPNTLLDADPASILSLKEYAAEGISFMPMEPMKWWNVDFKGKMRSQNDPTKFHDVKLETKWTSHLPWFLFDVDMPSKSIARAIAKEIWTKELFQDLKKAHQSHYEQMGYLKGTLVVDNQEYILRMDAFRDHSFGHKRDWSLMHRYIFHMLYLANSTKISLGVVCQPCTTSQLEMGYIVHPNGTLDAIEWCDLQLYQHGENGTPSQQIGFCFLANKVEYHVKINYEVTAVHYVGNNTEAKMHERFLSCEVNGVKGRGISEWHYNNVESK